MFLIPGGLVSISICQRGCQMQKNFLSKKRESFDEGQVSQHEGPLLLDQLLLSAEDRLDYELPLLREWACQIKRYLNKLVKVFLLFIFSKLCYITIFIIHIFLLIEIINLEHLFYLYLNKSSEEHTFSFQLHRLYRPEI